MADLRAWENVLRAERTIDETGITLWQLVDEPADLTLPNRFLRHLHFTTHGRADERMSASSRG